MSRSTLMPVALVTAILAACSGTDAGNSPPPPPPPSSSFVNNPCTPTTKLDLAPAQSALIDCSGGGTTLVLTGGGAKYLIVPQFPTDVVADQSVSYSLASGFIASASSLVAHAALVLNLPLPGGPGAAQMRFEQQLRARARTPATLMSAAPSAALMTPPTLGSTRNFRVISSAVGSSFTPVTATLAYIGNNIYLYIDNNAPANGFTSTQLNSFGTLFDQTLYGLDVAAFGAPSDVDGNGHVIMLMSPVVNKLSPTAQCSTEGYVAGFFLDEDFNSAADPNSNQGEIFYSIVPDPSGSVSCTHSVNGVGQVVPATFMHELQHLINFSQHAVINHGNPGSSWLDEGMSIVGEELGSLYYENKCPPPSCRTSPSQIFPDSSQGFAQSFLYDSYQYALKPDTASITLHDDSENGFAWRGGAWLLARYLGDQFGTNVYHLLETGPSDGVADIAAATGQPFSTVFANFGLALYADSFPGLPRTTAPAANRFVTRNLRQLWARLFVTSSLPVEMPIQLYSIQPGAVSGTSVMDPGTMAFWRLDTSTSDSTVAVRFATPAGNTFSSALHGQVAIMRLPAGQ